MANDFAGLVQEQFSFLVSEYGFQCVSLDNDYVRFESDKVCVSVCYDSRRSYEIDVEIGQLDVLFDGKERLFNLGEILRLEGVTDKENYSFFQANESEALSNCVSRLAHLLSLYSIDLLKNNKFSFKRLSDFREKECSRYELDTKLTHVKAEVRMAWKNDDYLRVVELYQPVKEIISTAEKKKLAFAQKQIKLFNKLN